MGAAVELWNCLSCKGVFTSPVRPNFCPYCRGGALALASVPSWPEYSQTADFGPDPESWNIDAGGDYAGLPGIGIFSDALQVWSVVQEGPVSVASAARAFNCTAARIIFAVRRHSWMYLAGPDDDYEKLLIEHEGE